MGTFLLFALLALSAGTVGRQSMLPGTILPVRLDTTLSVTKCKAGQRITARVMQRVPLPDGTAIRAGTRVVGHVIQVSRANNGEGGEIRFRFDRLKISRSPVPITISLRALASFMEIEDAQIPGMGPDRGTSDADYTTVQVGGDVVYRGGGPVMNGGEVVGEPAPDGVLVHPVANPEGGCRGAAYGNDRLQAFWLFSADACGTYGLNGVSIGHAGRRMPVGEIVLTSRARKLEVGGGAGMLLRVLGEGS